MKKFLKKHLIAGKHNNHQPHILRNRGIMVTTYFVFIIFGLTILQSQAVSISNFLSSILPNVLVDLANEERVELAASQLTINPLLVQAAQLKANDMAAKGYFAHVTPDGKDPWYFFDLAGYPYLYAGENLAMDFSDSSAVNKAWMASQGHRENILSRNFSEIGIATAEGEIDGRKTTFVVQMFGRPRSVAVASAQVNQPAPVVVEQVDVEPQVLEESETFIALVPDDPEQASPSTGSGQDDSSESGSYGAGEEADSVPVEVEKQSNVVARTATSPTRSLRILYLLISALILIAIGSIVVKQIRLHHVRQIASGVALMGLMMLLFFVAHSFLFTSVIIR
ncbi:MAG: CAP domain-containing protein [bacterium]|nr:CAP domain-containing protein [bacterium]